MVPSTFCKPATVKRPSFTRRKNGLSLAKAPNLLIICLHQASAFFAGLQSSLLNLAAVHATPPWSSELSRPMTLDAVMSVNLVFASLPVKNPLSRMNAELSRVLSFNTVTVRGPMALCMRFLYTETFIHRRFYTQKRLHTDAFTHRHFYTQTLSHTETGHLQIAILPEPRQKPISFAMSLG